MYKSINFFSFIFFVTLIVIFSTICYGADSVAKKENINKAKKVKNYEVIIPPVLELDSRTALTRNEINIIDDKTFENLSKYRKIFRKEINTIGLQYTPEWVNKLQLVVNEIKKYPNTIIILEGFRNTEISGLENIALSREHALFVASVFKDVYKISNTMAAIGRGLEKNENFIYNCIIISLIRDINPSDSIQ